MTTYNLISERTIKTLRSIPTQSLIDALVLKNWPMSYIEGARPLKRGQRMAGRAVTLRFIPHRPDIAEDKLQGDQSPEYVAIELCGPNEVLVVDAMGLTYSSIGGDIKFMRLKQRNAAGLVTDGSVRDSNALIEYGFPIYSASTTSKQGPGECWPWQVNDAIQCGGTLVRPGDAVVGDDDGVIIVPSQIVEEIVVIAKQRESVEEIVKCQLEKENCSPGKYYPFNDLTWELYEKQTGMKRPF